MPQTRLGVKRKKSSQEISPDWCLSFSLESLADDLSKLLDKKILPDVQLKIGHGLHMIPAHKAILAARSEVFAAKFQHGVTESTNGVLVLNVEDIEPSTFAAFMRYIYAGHISEEALAGGVLKLYVASERYAVSSLKMICSEFMIKHINEDNFLPYLTLADSHSDDELKNAVVSFITENEAMLKSDAWNEFSDSQPVLAVKIYKMYVEKKIQ